MGKRARSIFVYCVRPRRIENVVARNESFTLHQGVFGKMVNLVNASAVDNDQIYGRSFGWIAIGRDSRAKA